MDHTRENISDTMSCIHTVQQFCDIHSQWLLHRESELKRMRDITDRAEKINFTADHILKSKNCLKAFGEYMWSKVTQGTAESRAQELEKELGCLLQDTLKGLEKLTPLLEAVEMLAVTSLSVFEEENPVCQLPEGVSADAVRSVITATRRACPLLIHFKRDDSEFFMPSLVNVDLLTFQLENYLKVSQELCEKLQIRLDRHFRMTYLFRGSAQRFIGLFSQRCSRMKQFLVDLEEEAVQLDRMKMGASISSVAGSSVGLVGGIASIVGLALAPFTMGASLPLTMVGTGLGVTSGVNSIITGITECSVNAHHGKKIKEIFQSYFKDVETMLECLEQAARCIIPNTVPDVLDVATETFARTTGGVAKGIDVLVDCASAVKVVRAKEVASSAVKVVTQEVKVARNVPNMVADLTNIRQLTKGTPLALSKYARVGSIAFNSFFIGMDLFFICKDSISLANGDKSEVSKVIRRRASLWKTELDAWEKIHRSLCVGIWRFRRSKEVLRRPFYQRMLKGGKPGSEKLEWGPEEEEGFTGLKEQLSPFACQMQKSFSTYGSGWEN
ncbi:apolipoprotein L5-like [Conger conger]|uniref:apolipoprotein L5-like n=1 Tax=Conger conger TaxID=82655 RepID=UPI002A5AC9C0|nr:apolipoprotein L5-like [Conger conger]